MNNNFIYSKPISGWLRLVILLTLLFWTASAWALVITTPIITTIQDKAVIPGEVTYVTSTTFTIKGKSQSRRVVRVWLYRDGQLILDNIFPTLRGDWSATVTIPGEGSYGFQALASGVTQPFLSAKTKVATAAIDLTPPAISFFTNGNGSSTAMKNYMRGYRGALWSEVNDPVVGIASPSGLNFDTMRMTLKDYSLVGRPTIPGKLTTDYFEYIWWNPADGTTWDDGAETDKHQYQVSAYIEDYAGNQGSASYLFYVDKSNPPPVITEIYDPQHQEPFTGIGEDASNTAPIYDKGGWVKYYPYSTIYTNPPKLRGSVASWSVPYGTGFDTYRVISCTKGFGTWYGPISATDGTYQIDYNRKFPIGTYSIRHDSMDAACLDTCDIADGRTWANMIFAFGVPQRPLQLIFASGTFTLNAGSYYLKALGDTTIPDTIVKLYPLATEQTALVEFRDNAGYMCRLAQQVKKVNQIYTDTPGAYDVGETFQDRNWDSYRNADEPFFDNVPGAYDLGESYQDLNSNSVRDAGEPYVDRPARGESVSDGSTAYLPNFLGLKMHPDFRPCLVAYGVNKLGTSPCLGVIRFCLNNNYPPNYADEYCSPLARFIPRQTSSKPTLITYKAYTYAPYKTGGFFTGCCAAYCLNYANSWIRVVNQNGVDAFPPKNGSIWRAIRYQVTHQADINCSAVTFPDATYYIEATLADRFGHVVVKETGAPLFKMDNVPPNTTDEQPPPGGTTNSFSSFNARIVDPALAGDQSAGTGVELNPFKDQIWAFKRLTVDFTPVATAFSQSFPIADPVNGKAVNHYDEVIAPLTLLGNGENVEIWEKEAGKFTDTIIASSVITITSNGSPVNKITLKRTDAQFSAGKTYVFVYQIPCFTSNDGKDRVGAVPVEPIVSDGEYFVKIKTLDKAGNKGTVILNYTRSKIPFGTFDITPSTNLVISGLVPPDFVTFTSSQITCRDGTPLLDDQEMTLAQMGPGDSRPPDANGLLEDGIQIPVGIPSDPPNNGRFQCDFVMNNTTTGALFVAGFIGEASGTSPTVTVNRVNAFSISPPSVTLLITPSDPNPVASMTCSSLRDSSLTKTVPDGSLASWTYSTDFDPKPANLSHSGMSYWNSTSCLDNNLTTNGWHTNTAIAGAWVRVDLGTGFAMPYTKVRLNVQGGTYRGIYNVEYSDDNSSWTNVAEGLAPTGFGWVETFWDDVGPHRYWRLVLMNTPGSGGTVREMEWLGAGANFTTDEYPQYPGLQTSVTGGATSVSVSAGTKLVATVKMYIGGTTSPNCTVTILDRYPPPAPAWITPDVIYSTGTCRLAWPYSVDIGGAGTKEFRIEKSLNGGAYSHVATITMPAALNQNVTSLADGIWTFRVAARDNDLNMGDYVTATQTVIVDKAAPVAVPCTDNGIGNSDPDYVFSADSNVYFYWNATDTLSGVADVNIQIATSAIFTTPVYDGWIGNVNEYCFTGGVHKSVYYARVRSKDRCGNIGGWGTISDGIKVFSQEAMRPPIAPTIVSIASKPVVLGQAVATNRTSNLEIFGQCEFENLVEVWVDGVYLGSCLGDASGTYLSSATLTLGTHQVTTRAQNGYDSSEFSATATVIVEQTPPTLRMKVFAKDGAAFDNRNYISNLLSSELCIESFNMIASDTGGSGIDMTTASMTITDIDNSGNPIPIPPPGTNPIRGSTRVTAADTARFVPFVGTTYQDVLQETHRYRIRCQVSDTAGNISFITQDFVVDNVKPGSADGAPATTPPNCPIDKLYVYDLDAYPWPAMPPGGAIVPLTWNPASSAFMVDPAFVNLALVSDEYSPRAVLFNAIGVYGTVHIAEGFNPPAQAGKDSFAYKVEACWGYSSTITIGADGLGNQNTFRFPYLTVINGMLAQQLVVCDSAENRDYFGMLLNVRSPNLRPDPPSAVQFHKVADPSALYTVHTWDALFPMTGIDIVNREVFVSDNESGIVASIAVSVMEVPQTVEIIGTGGAVLGNATVAAGENHASITLYQQATPGKIDFQIRTVANGTRSLTVPRYQNSWYYHWIRNDTMSPELFNIFPADNLYNRLSGVDAKPFPTDYTVQAKDMASDTIRAFLRVAATEAALKDVNGTVVPGALSREYDPANAFYGFVYAVASTPETDGTYYYVVRLEDAASPGPHTTAASFPFKLDSIPPVAASIEPGDGSKTYAIDSFNAVITDPALPDGTTGAGPNMDTARVQIVPYKLLARGQPTSGTQFSNPVLGQDTTATDHTDRPLEIGEGVLLCELTGASRPTEIFLNGTVSGNSEDVLTVTSSGLDPAKSYAVLVPISYFTTNDGTSVVSAVPSLQIIKGGYYLSYVYPLDKALNRGAFVTASSLYEAAIGKFTLYPQRSSLYAGLVPPHVATFTSSPIMTTEELPIPAGIDITLKTDKGSFVPADSNGRPRDGHQVKSNADGTITFGLAATGNSTGFADILAKLGLAVASDQSVNLIPLPAFTVTPSTTSIDITKAIPNPQIVFTTSEIGNPGDLVPDGTLLTVTSTYGTLSPADADASVPGYQIRVLNGIAGFGLSSTQLGTSTLTIQAGGVTVDRTVSFNDRYPPSTPGNLSFNQTLNNTGDFDLSCGFALDYAGSGLNLYILEISSYTGSVWGPWKSLTSSKAPTRSFYLSGLAEGKYKFRVYATDKAGNKSDYTNESEIITVDKTVPTGFMVINSGAAFTTKRAVTISMTANDLNGVNKYRISNDGTSWTNWYDFTATTTWALKSGDGNKVVYVQYKDNAENISITYSDGIALDSTGPTGSFTTSKTYTTTQALDLLFTASDMNGVAAIVLSRTGPDGTLASQSFAFTPIMAYSLPPQNGAYTFYAQFFDGLGNSSEVFVANVFFDNTPPPVPTMIAEPTYSSGTANVVYCNPVSDNISPDVLLQFQAAQDIDFLGADTSEWTAEPFWEFTGLLHNKKYYYRARSQDGSLNKSIWSTTSVFSTQDTNAPTGGYIIAATNTDPDVKISRDTTVSFIGSALADAPSGIKNAYVEIASDTTFTAVNWSSGWFASTNGAVTQAVNVPNGTYLKARARFEDVAGNISAPMVTNSSIAIDLNAPIATGTTDWIGNTDPDQYATKGNTATFNFGGSTDPGFVPKNIYNQSLALAEVILQLEVDDNQGFTSPTIADTVTLAGTATSKKFNGLSEGHYRARIQVTDKAGWTSSWGTYSDGIWVDKTAPNTPLVVDDGEYSGNPTVLHATWVASESASGILKYEVCIGTSQNSDDIVPWTNAGALTEKSFSGLTLALDGVTLYYFNVRATDKAGNVSTIGSSDGIKAGDPSPPDPVTVTDDGQFTPSATTLHAVWTQSYDAQSGINRYEYAIGTANGSTNVLDATSVGMELSFTNSSLNLVDGITYYIHVRAVNGGNTPAPWSVADGITCDLTPPPVPVLNAEPLYSSGTSNIVSCPAVTDAISGGVEYEFQRATNAAFTSGAVSSSWLTAPIFSFDGLTHGTKYWFRVRTKDAVQNISAWSAAAISSTQDSNPPTGTYVVAPASNLDPDVNWSRDTTVSFTAVSLTDDLSGVQDVMVEIAAVSDFNSTLYSQWLGNTTGAVTRTLAVSNGTYLWARARFRDVAGNISGWFATPVPIAIDLNAPVAAATTDWVGNTDPDQFVSSDTNVMFTFSGSTDAQFVPKNIYNVNGTLKSVEVVVEVANQPGFTSTSIATDVVLAGTTTGYYFSGALDNKYYRARIKATDNAGWTTWGAYSDGIYIDNSAPMPIAGRAFFINEGQQTTASSGVKLCITLTDWSGIASISVMSNGRPGIWTTWAYSDTGVFRNESAPPPEGVHHATIYPNPISFPLSPSTTFGPMMVTLVARDIYGHMSTYTENILYINIASSTPIGKRDDKPDAFGERKYPIDTYDEFKGQNKYGVPGSNTGTIMRIGQ